ncbi:hypothetical protein AMIS_11540 [Actinoplanes missouriensis 431]|uniref:DUF5666 domain-containing protein n=1 Tax=Actinoplanes missouriensis (strain ATCC 14538 / DSM 43046 / CBS 188.64 / JCM 3121 / NBRC 102363 / NCIMB 12654 / NRRL B-3342 / UNCC 431) TaxID=512565 RepID=I0H037_ACTM4|nr:hypothetical protein [Actinoplanes missouriensis]BAL86374.1 hypothetical protein AMIS_11540 [Actinoplanes missouriensis 431]
MVIRRSVIPVALLLALSAGCANNTGTEPGAPAPAPSSAAIEESAATSAPSEDSSAPGKPAGGTTTLTGTITEGVEPGCLLLDGHLLIFNDAAQKQSVKAGDQITVTGTPAKDMMTTCQQGEPFKVSSVAGS